MKTVSFLLLFFAISSLAQEPKVLDSRYKLELIGKNPDIVTPIGICIDEQDRLLIIESHTHQPKGKQPFPHDRIRMMTDSNGDGTPDKWNTFWEGSKQTMSISRWKDGWIYVATRARIFRIKDTNGDGKADKEEKIANLETEANYPHNGLCGLRFAPDGKLFFGIGENFAKDYKLSGKNNTLTGSGEGGNVYRCDPDGSNIEFYATGIWNPFALCFDPYGRLFCVDNDPDSSPPCRLLQIHRTGDYGFQMRYGRSGTHPLQAWNGELPGTLPMLAGTGEAPCDVLPFHGQLLVTSWGHNRIEAYTYKTGSDSLEMKQKIIIQGSQTFRPVAFARSKDGSLYFTDWVNRSYPVHGQGKVWKLTYTPGAKESQFPPLSKNEIKIKNLNPEQALLSLLSESIYLHQAVAAALAEKEVNAKLIGRPLPQRKAVIMARRWRIFANLDPLDKLDSLIKDCLADDSAEIRFIGVRLIADYSLKKYKEKIIDLASRPGTSIQLFKAICSTVSWLETGKVTKSKVDQGQFIMVKMLRAEGSTEAIKKTILQFLPEDQPHLKLDELRKLYDSGGTDLKREALRLIIFSNDAKKFKFLADIADDRKAAPQLRADAITGLGFNAAAHRPLLFDLSESKNKLVAYEAARLLGKIKGSAKQPKLTSTEEWIKKIGGNKGDALAGWRVFFGPAGGQCYTCHKFQGKGKSIGPDLTTLAGQMSRERILESILLPDKEVGPLYQMWTVQTKDGKTFTGSPHGEKGDKKTFIDIQGKEFSLEKKTIKLMRPMNKSMMPSGLEKILTYEDLNNIITLLQGK